MSVVAGRFLYFLHPLRNVLVVIVLNHCDENLGSKHSKQNGHLEIMLYFFWQFGDEDAALSWHSDAFYIRVAEELRLGTQ